MIVSLLTVWVLSKLRTEEKPVTLIVPGPDPDEPTTVVPLARSTVCCTVVEVRFSGPSKVTPLSVPLFSAKVPAVELIVPPAIVPPASVSVPPVWLRVPPPRFSWPLALMLSEPPERFSAPTVSEPPVPLATAS